MFVYQNKLFFTGGTYNSAFYNNTYYATITNQTLSSWQATNAMPDAVAGHVIQSVGNKLYLVGGQTSGSTSSNKVYLGTISGTSISWAYGSYNFPTDLAWAGSAIYNNNFVYIIGGMSVTYGQTKNTIYYAQINSSDGQLQPWSTPVTLPYSVSNPGCAVNGNKLYIIGGNVAAGATTTAYYASLDAVNGSISGLTRTTPLPLPIGGNVNAIIHDGKIFLMGGTDDSATNKKIYFASLNADGTIPAAGLPGTWAQWRTTLPNVFGNHAVAVNNDSAIFISNGVFSNNTYGGLFAYKASAGSYESPIIDLGGGCQINSLNWDVQANGQIMRFRCRTADEAGQWDGWVSFASATPLNIGGSGRYLQYQMEATSDNNQTAVLNSVSVDYIPLTPTPTATLTLVPTSTPMPTSTPTPVLSPTAPAGFSGDILDSKYFFVAPNPTKGTNVIFKFFLKQAADVEIRIYTPQGSHVLTKPCNFYPQGWNTCIWNASGMANGVYFYIVEAKTSGVTEKLKVKTITLIK